MKKEFPAGSKEAILIARLIRLSLIMWVLKLFQYSLVIFGFVSLILIILANPILWTFTFFAGAIPSILIILFGLFLRQVAILFGENYIYVSKVLGDMIKERENA